MMVKSAFLARLARLEVETKPTEPLIIFLNMIRHPDEFTPLPISANLWHSSIVWERENNENLEQFEQRIEAELLTLPVQPLVQIIECIY